VIALRSLTGAKACWRGTSLYLGWRRLAPDLSEFDIAHFFPLKPVDIRGVRSRYKESVAPNRRPHGTLVNSIVLKNTTELRTTPDSAEPWWRML
jgi:hypothetical protein